MFLDGHSEIGPIEGLDICCQSNDKLPLEAIRLEIWPLTEETERTLITSDSSVPSGVLKFGDISNIIHIFKSAVTGLHQQLGVLHEHLKRERERADQAEARVVQAEARAQKAEAEAVAAESRATELKSKSGAAIAELQAMVVRAQESRAEVMAALVQAEVRAVELRAQLDTATSAFEASQGGAVLRAATAASTRGPRLLRRLTARLRRRQAPAEPVR